MQLVRLMPTVRYTALVYIKKIIDIHYKTIGTKFLV